MFKEFHNILKVILKKLKTLKVGSLKYLSKPDNMLHPKELISINLKDLDLLLNWDNSGFKDKLCCF